MGIYTTQPSADEEPTHPALCRRRLGSPPVTGTIQMSQAGLPLSPLGSWKRTNGPSVREAREREPPVPLLRLIEVRDLRLLTGLDVQDEQVPEFVGRGVPLLIHEHRAVRGPLRAVGIPSRRRETGGPPSRRGSPP